jgi:lactoylglutathione lyase
MTQCEFILFVHDQHRSREFYRAVLETDPVLDVPGMTEFSLLPDCKLGLLIRENAARILNIDIQDTVESHRIPRCELYLSVDDPTRYLQKALSAGAVKLSDARLRDWGDYVAYCADPDGHIVAFARKARPDNESNL